MSFRCISTKARHSKHGDGHVEAHERIAKKATAFPVVISHRATELRMAELMVELVVHLTKPSRR